MTNLTPPLSVELRAYLEKMLGIAPWASEIAATEILAIVNAKAAPLSVDKELPIVERLTRTDARYVGTLLNDGTVAYAASEQQVLANPDGPAAAALIKQLVEALHQAVRGYRNALTACGYNPDKFENILRWEALTDSIEAQAALARAGQ